MGHLLAVTGEKCLLESTKLPCEPYPSDLQLADTPWYEGPEPSGLLSPGQRPRQGSSLLTVCCLPGTGLSKSPVAFPEGS